MKHANIITKLTLEQKCALLSGEIDHHTAAAMRADIDAAAAAQQPKILRLGNRK